MWWIFKNQLKRCFGYLCAKIVQIFFIYAKVRWKKTDSNYLDAVYTVCGEKDPVNKYRYFRYSSIFIHKIFRDYSRHNLSLLLQILSHLSLFRSSTALNIEDDFFQRRRQITTNFQAYFKFKHMTRLKCRKTPQLLVVKNRNVNH